jgi:hypothetical protein
MKRNIVARRALLLSPAVCTILLGATVTAAWAQQDLPEHKLASKPVAAGPEAAHVPSTPPQHPQSISTEQAVYLVRSALLTLNDANRSGNYTVLRDLSSPDFQAKNTAADLTQSFADLRRRNFDLFAVAILIPQFTAPPTRAEGGLRLAGVFPTRPLQISFDLAFQEVGGQWRLFAISVATPEAPKTESQIIAPPRRFPSGLLYGAGSGSGTFGWRW